MIPPLSLSPLLTTGSLTVWEACLLSHSFPQLLQFPVSDPSSLHVDQVVRLMLPGFGSGCSVSSGGCGVLCIRGAQRQLRLCVGADGVSAFPFPCEGEQTLKMLLFLPRGGRRVEVHREKLSGRVG